MYSIFGDFGVAIPLLLLLIGIIIMLQASRAFQVNTNFRFIVAILISAILVIWVDFWPIQLVYAQSVATVLQVLAIPFTQTSTPHFGGVQILLFVQEAGSGQIIGGEIDNACAGLIVLIPALLLLWLTNHKQPPYPDTMKVGVLTVCLVVVGNFGRIVFELWAPAIALAPFDILHYPLALLLGVLGLIAMIWWGQHLQRPESW